MLRGAMTLNWEEKGAENLKLLGGIERHITELEARKRQIMDKNFKGVIGDEDAKTMIDEANAEITKLK